MILVLDNVDQNIPSTLTKIIQDNEKEISDILIVLSSFGGINRRSEHDFYKRWKCFNLYSELKITDTSDSVIERELYSDEKSHMWKIFVRFTRYYGKERDRTNHLSIISSMMKKYSY